MKYFFLIISLISLASCSTLIGNNFGSLTYTKATNSKVQEEKAKRNKTSMAISETETQTYFEKTSDIAASNSDNDLSFAAKTSPISKIETNITKKIKEQPTNDSCDRIVFKTGEEKFVKVKEVSKESITYISCSNLTGPKFEVLKSEVLFIEYSNGKKEIFKETPVVASPEPQVVAQTDPYAYNYRPKTSSENMITAGFILALLSYPLGIIFPPLPILGLIFSWSGLVKGRRDSYLARNEKLAIAGIILTCILFLAAMCVGFISVIYN